MDVDPIGNGRIALRGAPEQVDLLGSAVEALAANDIIVDANKDLHAEGQGSIEELRAIVGGFETLKMRDGTTIKETVVSHSGVVNRLYRGVNLLRGNLGLILHATGEDPVDSDLAKRHKALTQLSADLESGLPEDTE